MSKHDNDQMCSKAIHSHPPIQYLEALSILQAVAKQQLISFSQDEQLIPLIDAVGRICKSTYKSPHSTPTFDTSAMDGFAVSSALTHHASLSNPVIICPMGTIAAGDAPLGASSESKYDVVPCIEIMTGAPFPESTSSLPFDACIRIEDTSIVLFQGKATPLRRITKPASPFQNRRFAGTDFSEGDVVIGKGTVITAQHIMALASLGISTISVYRRLRVAILSTGSELLSYKASRDESNRIRDANGPYLQAALRQLGLDATYLGIVEDDYREFEEIVREALATSLYDAFITTGAVSVGKFDFVEEGLLNLNATIQFHRVAVRPGYPVLFALVPANERKPGSEQHVPFFCLPGNPLATVVCFRFLVIPYLRSLHDQMEEAPIHAQLNFTNPASPSTSIVLRKPDHLRVFWHGTLDYASKQVFIHNDQGSNKVRPILTANCWAVVLEGRDSIPHSSWIDCFPLLPDSLGSSHRI
jgi:molybdopterin molybdotransferase